MENKCHIKWKDKEKLVFRSIYDTKDIKISQSLTAANKNKKWVPLRAMKIFIRKTNGSYYVVSANKASSVTL